MIIDCATIRDLLPLYVDDVLSKESKALITGHLATCESCMNEFTNMQSVFAKLQPNDGENIDALKSMKKKISRQKAITAVTASVIAVAVVLCGVWYVFFNYKPVEYEQLKVVEVVKNSGVMEWEDGTTETVTILDIVCGRPFYRTSLTRVITINGVDTEVVYIYFSETLAMRWWLNDTGNSYTLGGTGTNMSYGTDMINNPSLPLEIYYLTTPYNKLDSMDDEGFYAERNNGVLLWSGMIE